MTRLSRPAEGWDPEALAATGAACAVAWRRRPFRRTLRAQWPRPWPELRRVVAGKQPPRWRQPGGDRGAGAILRSVLAPARPAWLRRYEAARLASCAARWPPPLPRHTAPRRWRAHPPARPRWLWARRPPVAASE